MTRRWLTMCCLILSNTLLLACEAPEPVRLGPADGEDLPATDLERVAVGTVAPDFTLESYSGKTVTLSDYRGQEVILVFYRGHW